MLRSFVKGAARLLGMEVHRFHPATSHAAQLGVMLRKHRIDVVFDIGANVGQFGQALRRHVGYAGRIVSFEPMKPAHEQLVSAASGDRLWQVAPRCALGSQEGTITINVAANSVSSSVLPMLEAHAQAAADSRYTATEQVPLRTLDALAPEYLRADSVLFMKVDTQGYESEVLAGAAQTLLRARGVQLELSLLPLYAGQRLMPELVDWMRDAGFELWALAPAFIDPNSGRLLQVDATFFRAGAAG